MMVLKPTSGRGVPRHSEAGNQEQSRICEHHDGHCCHFLRVKERPINVWIVQSAELQRSLECVGWGDLAQTLGIAIEAAEDFDTLDAIDIETGWSE